MLRVISGIVPVTEECHLVVCREHHNGATPPGEMGIAHIMQDRGNSGHLVGGKNLTWCLY